MWTGQLCTKKLDKSLLKSIKANNLVNFIFSNTEANRHV